MGNSQTNSAELLKELVFQILYAWVPFMPLAFNKTTRIINSAKKNQNTALRYFGCKWAIELNW
jgi:hypothetical protein